MTTNRLTHTKFTVFQQETAIRLGNKTLEADILHYILGLVTTLYKIKLLNTNKHKQRYIEEIGQFYWHLAGFCYYLQTIFDPFVPSPYTVARPFYDWARIEDRVLTIADYYREYLAEGKEFPSATIDILIREIFEYLTNIVFALEIIVEDCLQAIMDKIGLKPNPEIKKEVEADLIAIKKIITRYRVKGRPVKANVQALESLTIGEKWEDKDHYPARRRRKPGPRVNKLGWRRTLKKYAEQKRNRPTISSRKKLCKPHGKKRQDS